MEVEWEAGGTARAGGFNAVVGLDPSSPHASPGYPGSFTRGYGGFAREGYG